MKACYYRPVLEVAGIQLFAPNDDDPHFAPWVQMVRNLRSRPDARVIGLIPVTRRTGAWAAAVQLGVAVQYVTGEPVTIVDCNNRLPAPLEEASVSAGVEYFRREALPNVWIAGATKPQERFDLKWWQPLREAAVRGEHYVICDLTGLNNSSSIGSILQAFDCVASVAIAGKAWEWQLSRLHKLLPREQDAGVLFLERYTPKARAGWLRRLGQVLRFRRKRA